MKAHTARKRQMETTAKQQMTTEGHSMGSWHLTAAAEGHSMGGFIDTEGHSMGGPTAGDVCLLILAVGLSSFGPIRTSSTRVATRSGLARFWIHAEIDDVSGNSQWACSALDCYGYRRRGWQLAVALLSAGAMRMPTT